MTRALFSLSISIPHPRRTGDVNICKIFLNIFKKIGIKLIKTMEEETNPQKLSYSSIYISSKLMLI